jgi:hypothetical protein
LAAARSGAELQQSMDACLQDETTGQAAERSLAAQAFDFLFLSRNFRVR